MVTGQRVLPMGNRSRCAAHPLRTFSKSPYRLFQLLFRHGGKGPISLYQTAFTMGGRGL